MQSKPSAPFTLRLQTETGGRPGDYILWGINPHYTGPAGCVPIKITSGHTDELYRYAKRMSSNWTFEIVAPCRRPRILDHYAESFALRTPELAQ